MALLGESGRGCTELEAGMLVVAGGAMGMLALAANTTGVWYGAAVGWLPLLHQR